MVINYSFRLQSSCMELREVRSLVLLAESRSIRQTAERMHLTAAAVHKQLRNLSENLGVKLYEKIGSELHITPACEVLLPHFRDLLAAEEASWNAVEEWKGLRSGLVRIGTGRTISSEVLPCFLKRFRRKHSRISLYVETGTTQQMIERLVQGSLDLAVLMFPESAEQENLVIEAVWQAEIVLVSNVSVPSERCSLAQFERSPFILFQKGGRITNLIEDYFASLHFRPRVIMRFDDTEAIKAMVRSGLGMSMLPYWSVYGDLKRGTLKLMTQKERKLECKVALISRKRGENSSPAQAFISMARTFDNRSLRLAPR